MPDYKSMYYVLAAQVADAIELLIKAQQGGEQSAVEDEPALKIARLEQPEGSANQA